MTYSLPPIQHYSTMVLLPTYLSLPMKINYVHYITHHVSSNYLRLPMDPIYDKSPFPITKTLFIGFIDRED